MKPRNPILRLAKDLSALEQLAGPVHGLPLPSESSCDSVRTTFTALGPPTIWSLDDSLPPAQGSGIQGLLGGLPLPPSNLRGCPVAVDAPEIRLTSPVSYIGQPGSSAQPGGLIFAASVVMDDTVRILTNTIDFTASANKTCANTYGYLEYANFDWGYWIGTDPHDSLWTGYPYSDKGQLIALAEPVAEDDPDIRLYPFQLASLGRVYGPNALSLAETLPVSRAWAPRRPILSGSLAEAGRNYAWAGNARSSRLPSPGAIKPSTFQLTLNGTLIVSGSTPQTTGVIVDFVQLSGASVKLLASHSLLHSFNPAAPLSNSGGWNEVVATISDSTGHTSSVRARFPLLGPGPVAPVALAALRDFTHLDQGECAAVGIFQCGGVMLAHSIPGLITRDKSRDLHLVYRSASQRAHTILPIQLSVAREQKAPDSVRVVTVANGVLQDSLRYAGTKGQVSGTGSANLWEHADEVRIVGGVVPAPISGNASVRSVTARVRQYYPGSTQENVVSQDVVQLYLSDTLATRFGQGWQLAELSRLVLGQNYQGAPAAIWLLGDGSYTIFRQVGTVWTAPPGESSRFVALGSPLNGASYVLYRDDGSSLGFAANGNQSWTADLLGNRTTYTIDANGRLNSIADPSGKKVIFNYGSSGAALGNVTGIDLQLSSNPADLASVASFAYDTVNGASVLAKIKMLRTPGAADSTLFAYRRGTSKGAFVDSIVDPRSTAAKPVVSKFSWDTVTYTPESVQRAPDRIGVATMYIRDQWRRAIPRIGKGRFSGSQALERMVYPNQLRGTVIGYGGAPTDFRVDRFGSPTFVSAISQGTVGGGFFVPTSAGDDIRDIERDTVGRVTKIVHGRNFPGSADSVMYQYDGLSRVVQITRNTAAYPVPAQPLDVVSFTYDSLSLAAGGVWCSRLLSSVDPLGFATTVGYGSSGAARCLPSRMVGLAADTTLFTYGALTAGDVAGVRPVKVRDPVGLSDSVSYDAGSWNTVAHVRLGDLATSRAFYDGFGRPDSLMDPEGKVTRFKRDRSGRVTHQQTGSEVTSTVARTIYDAGGLVTQTDVYAALPADITTPTGTVQSTRNYFDRLGQLDSTIVPGVRTAGNKAARIQSFLRDRNGVPAYEFTGNGSYIGRMADWRGRITQANYGVVDPSRSVDGERFADDSTKTIYGGLSLANGAHLSNGQVYGYYSDNKGQPSVTIGRDVYLGGSYLTQRSMGYSRRGGLVGDTLKLSDGATIFRRYQYNRRGQRTLAADTATVTSGSLGAEATGAITYHYNTLTARLDSMVAVSGAGSIGRVRWLYDRAGRDTLRAVQLAGTTGEVVTTRRYDSSGRGSYIQTANGAAGFSGTGANGKEWFRFASPVYDHLDHLASASGMEPDFLSGRSYAYEYSTDGAWRLTRSQMTGSTTSITYNWTYDVFGNRLSENYGTTGSGSCLGTFPMGYGADNRLLVRHSSSSCSTMSRYWTDQAGNRLVETDSLTDYANTRAALSYTAANQLYYSVTPKEPLGAYDYNWHWYDGDGRRVITQLGEGTSIFGPRPEQALGGRQYYFYDGDDVALMLVKMGTTWQVRQRFMSGGVDQPLVTRVIPNGLAAKNLAFVADGQGTTLAAIGVDGLRDQTVAYFGRNPFGKIDGATGTGSTTKTETGFTGASTPNQTGGFTYLRNRWYDPQSGRFLTQDPIGLAGGVNLYAYAGNNPVTFSDPFGLCPWCEIAVVGLRAAAGMVISAVAVKALQSMGEAGELVPTAGARPTAGERGRVNEIGGKSGCMTCGATDPGTASGNWVANHVPPTSVAMPGEPQFLGPHCLDCSNKQGGFLRQLLQKVKDAILGDGPSGPALPAGAVTVEPDDRS